jgi:hypothetical protein
MCESLPPKNYFHVTSVLGNGSYLSRKNFGEWKMEYVRGLGGD